MIDAAVAAIALSVSPARVALEPREPAVIRISGPNVPVVVTAVGYGLDLRGRQRVLAAPSPWLVVAPRRVKATRAGVLVTLRARLPRRAAPGDRFAVVLVTAIAGSPVGVGVRARLGVVTSIRVPGKVVRRIVVRSLRLGRRAFELTLANTGNVVEKLRPAEVTVGVGRARLHPRSRELLPHTRAVFELPWGGAALRRLVAHVRVRGLSRTMVCKSRSGQGEGHRNPCVRAR